MKANSYKDIILGQLKAAMAIAGGKLPLEVGQERIADELDVSASTRDLEIALQINGRAQDKIRALQAALARIDEGTYGYCMECGDVIHAGRLKANPTCTFCIECQSRSEKQQKIKRMLH